MMYEGFAAVYDTLMADVDYAAWADFYLAMAARAGITGRRAADAACGTGSLTLELAARGLTMTGLDLSVEMLQMAGTKARSRGLPIPFIRQDMRKLLLHRPMDAVFSACDGVNYLVRPGDVQSFFAATYQSLRPGGGFFFDISTEHKLRNTLGNNCLGEDREAVSYLWQNHFDEKSCTLQMDLTFFVRGRDGRYDRFTETHFQRAHTADEIIGWLREAGFIHHAVYGDRTFSPPKETDARIHFAAVKPE